MTSTAGEKQAGPGVIFSDDPDFEPSFPFLEDVSGNSAESPRPPEPGASKCSAEESPPFSESGLTTSEEPRSKNDVPPDSDQKTSVPASNRLPRLGERAESLLLLGILAALAITVAVTAMLSSPAMRVDAVSRASVSLTPVGYARAESASGDPAVTEESAPPWDGALVNLNTATSEELQTLPGIGETMAERILAYREQHGAFTDPQELLNVRGIGTETYRGLADRVTIELSESAGDTAVFPIDLNTADAATIALLPGVGDRLAAELVEYRAEHGTFHWFEQLLNVKGFGETLLGELKGQITLGEYASPHEYRQYPININTASAETLDLLPGVGESTAAKIIAYREQHGPFTSLRQLLNVSGIGEAKLEGMIDLISLETAPVIPTDERVLRSEIFQFQ